MLNVLLIRIFVTSIHRKLNSRLIAFFTTRSRAPEMQRAPFAAAANEIASKLLDCK